MKTIWSCLAWAVTGLLFIFAVMGGLYTGNETVVIGLVPAVLTLFFIKGLGQDYINLWSTTLLLAVLPFFGSTFLFRADSSNPSNPNVWVVEDTVERQGWIAGIPFYHRIEGLSTQRRIFTRAVATTQDGTRVQGLLKADAQINAADGLLVRLVHQFTDTDEVITAELEKHLQECFQATVQQYAVAELPEHLMLEYGTASHTDGRLLTKLGVQWAGTLEVSDIHLYLAAN